MTMNRSNARPGFYWRRMPELKTKVSKQRPWRLPDRLRGWTGSVLHAPFVPERQASFAAPSEIWGVGRKESDKSLATVSGLGDVVQGTLERMRPRPLGALIQ